MFFESLWLNYAVAIGLIVALTFDYVTKFFSYWYVRHIPYNTSIPFFGSDYYRVLGIKSNTKHVNDLYKQFPKEDLVGSVKSRIPDLIVKNPDLIKEVLSTEFQSFKSRGLDLDKSQDICLRNNLFYAEGEKWTVLREGLETLLNDVTLNENCFLESLSGTNGNINVLCLLTKVLDVVFGNLLGQDETVISELRAEYQKRSLKDKLLSYLKSIFPSLYVLFGLTTTFGSPSKETSKIIHETDFAKKINSIFKANEKTIKTKSEYLSSGIVLMFISEGYVPCLNLLTSVFFELSKNVQMQNEARNSDSDQFIEAIINETMRLHPPFSVITRKCVKTFKFSQSKVLIDKGVTVNVPVDALHKDETYYKEPNVFKPERFLTNDLGHSYSFLPYGAGPRKCLGESLSRDIVRSVTKAIIKKFIIEPTEETPETLKVIDHNFSRVIDNDIWLRFKPIM